MLSYDKWEIGYRCFPCLNGWRCSRSGTWLLFWFLCHKTFCFHGNRTIWIFVNWLVCIYRIDASVKSRVGSGHLTRQVWLRGTEGRKENWIQAVSTILLPLLLSLRWQSTVFDMVANRCCSLPVISMCTCRLSKQSMEYMQGLAAYLEKASMSTCGHIS